MEITGKIELSMKQFVELPWNPYKTHILVGVASEHINASFNEAEIQTSNVNYIDVVDGVVYAITHSKSCYELTNVTVDEVFQMIQDAKTRDIAIHMFQKDSE